MPIMYVIMMFQFLVLALVIKRHFQEIMIHNHEFPTIVVTFFYILATSVLLTISRKSNDGMEWNSTRNSWEIV